jgi:SAM-dependent methyltransferase
LWRSFVVHASISTARWEATKLIITHFYWAIEAKSRSKLMTQVLPHNSKSAATWGSGGEAYDKVSESIADAIDHVVNRIWPQPAERILDVATGTGWTARRLASRGAKVTGVDIGEGVIAAAKRIAPEIDFKVGDAEGLEFLDQSFDCVTSTFGIMFVSRPEAAAAELARVTRKGGRLGLVTWLPGSAVEELFQTMRPYMPPPPDNPPPSPFAWGREDRVRQLLGDTFDLTFERGTTVLRMPSGETAWDIFVTGYGPTKTLAASLEPERRAALERDFVAMHEKHRTSMGLAMPREYLCTIGIRK